MLAIIASFVVVFALILLAVSVGFKFFDARRKTQMVNMLQTATGEAVVTITSLLKEIEPENPGGFRQVVSSLQFAKHAEMQIQQAGLTWTASKLITIMCILAVAGFAVGLVAVGMVVAFVLAAVFAAAPYLYVRRTR